MPKPAKISLRGLIACLFWLIAAGLSLTAQPCAAAPMSFSVEQRPGFTSLPVADQLGQSFQQLINPKPLPVGTAQPAALPTGTTAPQPADVKPVIVTPFTAAPVTATPVAAGTAQPAAADDGDESTIEPVPTFGSRALSFVMVAGEILRNQATIFITNFAALPELSSWTQFQVNDDRAKARWASFGNDSVSVVGPALLAFLLMEFAEYPLRRRLRSRQPIGLSGKLMAIGGFLLLRAVPMMVFVGVAITLLDRNETLRFPRFMILNVVYALTLSRAIIIVWRGILAPGAAAFRVTPIGDEQAGYFYHWLSVFSMVIVYGYFVIDVSRSIRVPAEAVQALTNSLGLILMVMMVVVIMQKRALVATLLRGHLSAAQPELTPMQDLRLWMARNWHHLAIAYLVIGYSIAALGVTDGLSLMLRGTVLTLLIFAVLFTILKTINRWAAYGTVDSITFHRMFLQLVMRGLAWIVAGFAIAFAWGANIARIFTTPFGHRILGSVFSISVTLVILTVVYEAFNTLVEKKLNPKPDAVEAAQVSARMRTLLPMARNTVLILFAVIVGFVVLSEVGVNVAPLLAGAGVLGVAFGFGSQTLVKDFLTGLFIVIENTVAIGDVVKIGDHAGVVESMTIRTLRLRDGDGAIHTLAFSEVSKVINMTRDFAIAAFSINVPYDTNLEQAMNTIRTVGEELQADPLFKRVIMTPIEVFGVDSLNPTSITLLAQIRTNPGKQWDVKRMFLLRLKQRFDKEGIIIPAPTAITLPSKLALQSPP